jgi:hypothetical protein
MRRGRPRHRLREYDRLLPHLLLRQRHAVLRVPRDSLQAGQGLLPDLRTGGLRSRQRSRHMLCRRRGSLLGNGAMLSGALLPTRPEQQHRFPPVPLMRDPRPGPLQQGRGLLQRQLRSDVDQGKLRMLRGVGKALPGLARLLWPGRRSRQPRALVQRPRCVRPPHLLLPDQRDPLFVARGLLQRPVHRKRLRLRSRLEPAATRGDLGIFSGGDVRCPSGTRSLD